MNTNTSAIVTFACSALAFTICAGGCATDWPSEVVLGKWVSVYGSDFQKGDESEIPEDSPYGQLLSAWRAVAEPGEVVQETLSDDGRRVYLGSAIHPDPKIKHVRVTLFALDPEGWRLVARAEPIPVPYYQIGNWLGFDGEHIQIDYKFGSPPHLLDGETLQIVDSSRYRYRHVRSRWVRGDSPDEWVLRHSGTRSLFEAGQSIQLPHSATADCVEIQSLHYPRFSRHIEIFRLKSGIVFFDVFRNEVALRLDDAVLEDEWNNSVSPLIYTKSIDGERVWTIGASVDREQTLIHVASMRAGLALEHPQS